MPQWYTQMILAREREKDRTLADFLDLFHHRLISLFYLAWKNIASLKLPAGARDRLSRYLLSLSGLGTPGLTDMIGLPEEALTFYSGLLSSQSPLPSPSSRPWPISPTPLSGWNNLSNAS